MSERRPLCAHCIYWMMDHTADPPTAGHCHRMPPGIYVNPLTGTIVQKFPMTDRSQWCGEWSDDEKPLVEAARHSTLDHVRDVALNSLKHNGREACRHLAEQQIEDR